MKLLSLRKPLIVTIFTIALLSYGFIVVNAAYPTTQWEPGETLDPTCAPGVANCSVATGWQLDLTSGYVFNDTDFIGIGTSTPTVELDVVGQMNVTDSLVLSIDDNDTYVVSGQNNITTNLSSAGDISGQYISNTKIDTTWNGTDNVTNSLLSSVLSKFTVADGTGSVNNIGSGSFYTQIEGGTVGQAYGLLASSEIMSGSPVVSTLKGIIGRAVNETSNAVGTVIAGDFTSTVAGNTEELYGINGVSSAQDYAEVDFSLGLGFYSFAKDHSTITSANGMLIRVAKFDTATIGSATGIEIAGGTYPMGELGNPLGNYPGVGANGAAYGIRMSAGVEDYAIESVSNNAYGLYIGEDAIGGLLGSYALYVNDATADNFLRNGVRIGVDSDNYKLQGAQNGLDAELYFGTNLVASYTPSDERLKTDIDPTEISLADLSQINIVDFTYDQEIINDNSKRHHGVIAQELELIYPNAVKERIDGYKVVDYSALVPLLIKSIQDLQQEINNQAISLIDNVREIFVRKVTTEEFCMGNRCIDEEQFNELVDLLEEENNQDRDIEPIVENEIIEPVTESEEGQGEQQENEITEFQEQALEQETVPALEQENVILDEEQEVGIPEEENQNVAPAEIAGEEPPVM